MDVSDTLNKAADLIEERGWTRGTGWFPEPGSTEPVCIEGALNALLGGKRSKWDCPAWNAVADYLSTVPGIWIGCLNKPIVWSWNDRTCRGQAEAVAVLRATALIAAARESRERETAEVSA